MKLTVGTLLSERGWTAYELSKKSGGRISMSAAYRLADGKWKCLSSGVMDALCDVLEIEPAQLFVRESVKKGRGKR